MRALARTGAALPGGWAAPVTRKIENVDEWDQTLRNLGYVLCAPCREWHRQPECWITEEGIPALEVDE